MNKTLLAIENTRNRYENIKEKPNRDFTADRISKATGEIKKVVLARDYYLRLEK